MSGPPLSEFGELADRLESVIADLDDLAFRRLREAVAEGAQQRPQSDKELTRARRSAEKAVRILRALEDGDGSDHPAT
jgi:hypothetical protein